ncbi:DUF1007 family protein [uncultured Tateyamaria sp.]|uniref:DUF1007 family protein n=1 Tax=uncultured Tateyamaria sp. TaxID=455651 RepID=UPI00262FCDE3|nr:DUF1007 family protein [uncultured Tateyamaria sp.]
MTTRYICVMQMRTALLLSSVMSLVPVWGAAHPHVFVDTELTVYVDATGQMEGIEVAWTYDDFYSLLILADLKLDNDGDGRLDPSELQRLDGFDLQWVEGYQGDSYVTRNGKPASLGAPETRGVSVDRGLITSRHFRALSGPADGVEIKAFDPTFYTAYSLTGTVTVKGPCTATQTPADLDAAYTLVEELLYATPAADLEEGYPEVGEAFADTVSLSCTS